MSGGAARSAIARAAIDRSLFTWMLMVGCLLGGVFGFYAIGRLEDPAFTIKQALITTVYPGASAAEVASEVSEVIEAELQSMAEVKTVESENSPGFSLITVEVEDKYDADTLPDVWTRVRERVQDVSADLPSAAMAPAINDSFGDVYGIFYAISAPGFTDAEIHDIATFLQRELLAVDGVADIELAGLPEEAVYIEPILPILLESGIPIGAILDAIATSDSVANSGSASAGASRILIEGPAGSDTAAELSQLTVGFGGQTVHLRDIAEVRRLRDPRPRQIIRHDGEEAFTLGVSGVSTENIVTVGERVDARLAELQAELPVGVKISPIYEQHIVVDEASAGFVENLGLSVGIVIVVLGLAMGARSAVVVGATLALTVAGTVFLMYMFGLQLERISLGALIIAMGMLVDNALVVAEGMQIQMLSGRSSRDAAEDVGRKTTTPLLGATVIGIMAFAGIGTSQDATGEFLFSLFAVIGISLILSWVLAITVTPLLAHYVFKRDTQDSEGLYAGRAYQIYRKLLQRALSVRGLVVAALVAITAFCYYGFTQVKQSFFPPSTTPLLFVHMKAPQGTEVAATAAELERVEAWLLERDDVVSVTTIAGGGATRFMLTYAAKNPNASYGHMIVRTPSPDDLDALRADLDAFGLTAMPFAEFRTERLPFGPSADAEIEVRLSGPDPVVLRQLAVELERRMVADNPDLSHPRVDWREQEIALQPIYATDRAETAGLSRDNVADTLLFATDGFPVGSFREGDRLIPIVIRLDPEAGFAIEDMEVYSETAATYLPLAQMIDGFELRAVDTLIQRYDRRLTITIAADAAYGAEFSETAAAARARIVEAVETLPLPVGYEIEWGGDHESSTDAQQSLASQLPPSLLIMVLISIFLFGALRQPIVIWLIVPMSVNGVVIGLLGADVPFTFTALLGLLSLSGMLIKNGIVLVEEIDITRRAGVDFDTAVLDASVSRLRPIVLAAATTSLGMLPLLWDAFFESMAVTIMGGLAFATILTLIGAPVLYSLIVRRDLPTDRPREAVDDSADAPQPAPA